MSDEPAGRPVAADGPLPHGQGQDPSTDVLRTGEPTTPVSAAVGNPSTDRERSDSRSTTQSTGSAVAAPLAPSPTASAVAPRRPHPAPAATCSARPSAVTPPGSAAWCAAGLLPRRRRGPTAARSTRPSTRSPRPSPASPTPSARVVVDRGELTLHVDPQRTAEVCQALRDGADLRYELLRACPASTTRRRTSGCTSSTT